MKELLQPFAICFLLLKIQFYFPDCGTGAMLILFFTKPALSTMLLTHTIQTVLLTSACISEVLLAERKEDVCEGLKLGLILAALV